MCWLDTGAWTHADFGTAVPDAPATTVLALGAEDAAGTKPWPGEIWQQAAWQGQAMSDIEVERLAKIPRLEWSRLAPDFYVRWDNGREVGDMFLPGPVPGPPVGAPAIRRKPPSEMGVSRSRGALTPAVVLLATSLLASTGGTCRW